MSDLSDEVVSSDGSEEEVKSKSKKPAVKKRPEPSDSDSGSDEAPPPKKSSKKPDKSDSKKKSSSGKKEKEPEKKSWELSNTRAVSINEFKGQVMVDIREYYMDNNGDKKPGKKGISLNLIQWGKLVDAVKEIDAAVKKASD